MTIRPKAVLATTLLLLVGPSVGHHSDAGLDMGSIVTVEGVVTEYTLRNPHSYFVVAATNRAGETIAWEIQMGSALSMSRRGWTAETLAVGNHVVVDLHPARDGRSYGLITAVERDGLPISYERLPPPETQVGATTIEGVWMVDRESLGPDYPGGLDQLMNRDLELTDKGRAAKAAFDQNSLENPELSCATKPTPGAIVYTDIYPLQIEIVEDRRLVVIRSQYFDQERAVYMDGRGHPPADERTHEGHSIGWWESDVLVVDTTNFADDRSPYQNGVPSGMRKHVVERYRLREGGSRMTVQFVLEDPDYIVGSMTHIRDLRYSPHIEMAPFDCDLEATRRYLPKAQLSEVQTP